MSEGELYNISARIVRFRTELDAINMMNSNCPPEVLVDIEIRKAKAKIGLQKAKREYNDYIQDQVDKI